MTISMPAKEVAARLAMDVEAVARKLLPAGQRCGHEWEVGSIAGGTGRSLKVRLSGEKAGIWADFATGDAGDLLDLWAKVHGIDISEAMREARAYLGVSHPAFEGHRPKTFTRPQRPRCRALATGRVRDYLTGERGLCDATLQAFKVAATESDNAIVFPYLRNGELILAKRLMLERIGGRKDIQLTETGCEPCLFGWQAVPPTARMVVICEGEIDAMSIFQAGYPALSVPFGGGRGGKQAWIEFEFEYLERFDDIVLCFDADPEGRAAVQEVAERLGIDRVRVASLPASQKDANSLLVALAGQTEEFARAVRSMVDSAAHLGPEELKSAALFVDEVIREFYPHDGEEPGFDPPFPKARQRIRFRWAELTLLNGVNGHGKSQLAGQLCLEAAAVGERVCIASLELKPRKLLRRLTLQAAGLRSELPSIPFIRAIHEWYRDKFWIFDVVGTAKADRLLEVFRYARRRYGVRVFLVDSLMKCGLAETDYDGQKLFLERLCDFKNEFDVHVFLVTHARKGESEDQPTGKMDVKGTGAIADLCDNGFTLWRNRRKETQIAELEIKGEAVPHDVRCKPDAMLYCWKQRNGDWERQISLWWHPTSNRFIDCPDALVQSYVDWSASEREAAR